MESGKTLRYNDKQLYYTEGTEGIILHNPDANTITKLIRIVKREANYNVNNPHIKIIFIMLQMYSLAPCNIPKIYDFGYIGYNGTSARMYSGDKNTVLERIKDGVCQATVMEKVIPTDTPYKLDWSIITQLFWVAHCISTLGYIHNDIFWRNIIITKAKSSEIICGNTIIPSNGFEVKILDFSEVQQLTDDNKNNDMYTILQLMVGYVDYNKFIQRRHIKYIPLENIVAKFDNIPIKNVKGAYLWGTIYEPVQTLKYTFGDEYFVELKQSPRYPLEDLKKMVMLNSSLECFEYCLKKLNDVKIISRKLNLIPFETNDKEYVAMYLKLRVTSPFTFAPIKYYFADGIEYDLPENTNTNPNKKSIKETIDALKKTNIVITKFDKSNYVICKNGTIVLYNIQHLVYDNKKCIATKYLSKLH